jgi:DNA-binding transcriptional LysR family regulator
MDLCKIFTLKRFMRRKIPSITSLMAFEAAARHESFTEAAHEMSLTQSAICRQIGGLEDLLGTKLFRRTRRGVLVTEAGRAYCRKIAVLLDSLEHETFSLMAHQGRGRTIELAVMPTFATCWLIPRLNAFYASHADVRVNLTPQTRPFLFDQTEFDASLYYGAAGWPGTDAHFLMHEQAVPVCSPRLMAGRTSLSPAEISALPLLQQTTRPYAWRDWFGSLDFDFAGAMSGTRMELFTMLAKAAAQDMGIALMPTMLIEAELNSGELVMALNHYTQSDNAYFLILPEQKSEDLSLQAFRDWLIQEASYHGAVSSA